MIDTDALRRSFRELYGHEARLFYAPGRVNLIGEHTDYNDGFVLPMAIDLGTAIAAAVRADRHVRVRTLSTNQSAMFDLDRPGPPRRGLWLDYVEGVAQALEKRGMQLRGADLLIQSDVPAGAGLSSSAALEISTGLALLSLAGAPVNRVALALAGQSAEHEYVGIKCGIMDQFVSALGRAGHALLIDCRSLEATPVPLDTTRLSIVICDTRVKHTLAASEYNLRRAECRKGVELLRAWLPGIAALRDVSQEDFERYEARLPEKIRARCRHVVTENARTLAAAVALRAGEIEELGRLMIQSHQSLRDDYEVSCRELDLLFEIALSLKGATVGTRMTGGGFGGCTVSLVRRDALEDFRFVLSREYQKATGLETKIYISEACGGAREL